MSHTLNLVLISGWCPWTFDGWACWNSTPAGQETLAQCPKFVIGFNPDSKYRYNDLV